MWGSLILSLLLALQPGPSPTPPAQASDDVLRALYEGGRTFQDFLSSANRRTELWNRLARDGTVPEDLAARARAVGGTWRILTVAEDWCGDSANNVPYVAKLVEAVEGLDMRIVDSTVGRAVMEGHRTPDGRAATPTLVLLDEGWNEVGCFIERPARLVEWTVANRGSMDDDALHDHIYAFYDAEKGRATLSDVVEMLEAAAAGRPTCGASAR